MLFRSPTPAPVQPTPAPVVQPVPVQNTMTPQLLIEGMLNYFISSKIISGDDLNSIVKNVTGVKVVSNEANALRILNMFTISNK